MNKTIKIFGFFVLIFLGQISYGQTNKEQAVTLAIKAIKLEDEEGKFNEAILLLEEAQRLDPENINYPYELAYAYSGKKDYKKASDILENLLKHKDVHSRVYHALGNAYDYQGKSKKAIATYEKGLGKFPNSGELCLELGNIAVGVQDYEKALNYFEKGIENDPAFPSNYYWAAKLFCSSDEEVWGMIYGEIFINLENNTNRTSEISKLLFDTYKREIKFASDTTSVSFSEEALLLGLPNSPSAFKLPFGICCYEIVLLKSVLGVKRIDLYSLDQIRNHFVDSFFTKCYPKDYPNILFDYQQAIKNAGHFEAYNHWLLMKGDEDEFEEWQQENKKKWNDFIQWYPKNNIKIDLTHRFFRRQY